MERTYTTAFPYVYLPTHGFLLPYMDQEPLFKDMGVNVTLPVRAGEPKVGHMVYFTLKDNSAKSKKALVDACKKYLQDHEGVEYFTASPRHEDFKREVNDQDWDVALHLVFTNKAAHDKYQDAKAHLQFIEENKAGWKKVRVFDSAIESYPSGGKVTYFVSTAPKNPAPAYRVAIKSYFSPEDPSISKGLAEKLAVSKANSADDAVPKPTGGPSGATSYAANFRLFGVLSKGETQVLSFDRALTIANISDGSSNTIVFAEKYGACTADAAIEGAPTNQGIPVKPAGSGGNLWGEPNLNENAPFFSYPQGGNSTYTTGAGLKFQLKPQFDKTCNPFRAATPREDTILVALADGSVRKVSVKISDKTWHQAVVPDDNMPLGSDW